MQIVVLQCVCITGKSYIAQALGFACDEVEQ